MRDLGHYQFKLYWAQFTDDLNNSNTEFFDRVRFKETPASQWTLNPDLFLNRPYVETGAFQLIFRFYPDGSSVGPLHEGEIALFENCNYEGKAVVIGTPLADLRKWNSDVVELDKFGASIRLGNNTALVLYADPAFSGPPETLSSESSCQQIRNLGSIQIPTAKSVLLATGRCQNCQLERWI